MVSKRLIKGPDKMLDGICSGIAQYFELDVTLVRLAYILFTVIFPLSMILFYFIMIIVIPKY